MQTEFKYGVPIALGHHVLLPVEDGVNEFYLSGTGYVCARKPRCMTLSESPVTTLGIRDKSQILGFASLEHKIQAGINPDIPVLLLGVFQPGQDGLFEPKLGALDGR